MKSFLSKSGKVATISFTLPGEGRITVQENPEVPDERLRKLIHDTSRQFFAEFTKLEDGENKVSSSKFNQERGEVDHEQGSIPA
jgi:hypothetical protein